MGRHHHQEGGELSAIRRVVPDVASFSVDDGFAYALPDGLDAPLGSIVRIPLGGRRVRGWVVGAGDGDASGLKEILSRSGDLPVFDEQTLAAMRWAAIRYVAPLATVVAKAMPPNLPRLPKQAAGAPASPPGGRASCRLWLGAGPWHDEISAELHREISSGAGALVVAPTVVEAETLAAGLRDRLGDAVIGVFGSMSAAEQTRAWVKAATGAGSVLVGTRGVALWPVSGLSRAFVVGEGRTGMKDKATPTTHARDLLLRRGQLSRFEVVMTALVPSAEALERSRETIRGSQRLWGHVEVVDRRAEEMDGHLLGPTARQVLRAAVAGGRRVLVFTDRRQSAQRCARCKALRVCEVCGSGFFAEAGCVRCETRSSECGECGFARFEVLGAGVPRLLAEAARVVGRSVVGEVGSASAVVVGTERDLPGMQVDQTIIVDADGALLAPNYRAAENALRIMARAVAAAGRGRGRKGLIQTSNPSHPIIEALRRGDPTDAVAEDASNRRRSGFPPGGELVVVEVADAPAGAVGEMEEAIGDRAEVLGPADGSGRMRWLIQGSDLTSARVVLRGLVGRWREGGARVRVDADPVAL